MENKKKYFEFDDDNNSNQKYVVRLSESLYNDVPLGSLQIEGVYLSSNRIREANQKHISIFNMMASCL